MPSLLAFFKTRSIASRPDIHDTKKKHNQNNDSSQPNITSPATHHRIGRLAFIKILHWWTIGDADEVMAWGVEEIATMRGVDVEEDAGDDDSLFLQKLFEECLSETRNETSSRWSDIHRSLIRILFAKRQSMEWTHQAVINWCRELLEVEPDVECARRRNGNFQT